MAKQKMMFLTKIKFVFWWLLNYTKGTMTIVSCGNCNSKRVTFKNGNQENNIYIYILLNILAKIVEQQQNVQK